jgi:hypothetical protein
MRKACWTTAGAKTDLRVSSGFVAAVRATMSLMDGVADVRLLHRSEQGHVSKFFVVLQEPSLDALERVVGAMVQLEEAFRGGARFDYDTVPSAGAALIPPSAHSILNGNAA